VLTTNVHATHHLRYKMVLRKAKLPLFADAGLG
jgi:hypothetical protein